ncbi:MAG: hypothetical protein M3R00_02170 [Pseudomonadota bacterium]|nr:hypothetical protein [Pseudomonadota bacterium]
MKDYSLKPTKSINEVIDEVYSDMQNSQPIYNKDFALYADLLRTYAMKTTIPLKSTTEEMLRLLEISSRMKNYSKSPTRTVKELFEEAYLDMLKNQLQKKPAYMTASAIYDDFLRTSAMKTTTPLKSTTEEMLQLFEILSRMMGAHQATKFLVQHYNPKPLFKRLLPDPRMQAQTLQEIKDAKQLDQIIHLYPIDKLSDKSLLELLHKLVKSDKAMQQTASAQPSEIIENLEAPVLTQPEAKTPVESQEKVASSMMFKTREQHEQLATRAAVKEQKLKAGDDFHVVLRLRPKGSSE